MGNKKRFLQGALCGALAMLLMAGLVSCGLRLGVSSGVLDQETAEKLEVLEQLVNKMYFGDVDQEELRSGIYEGYISGLDDPYSVYYDEKATEEMMETTSGEYDGIGAVMSQNLETGVITVSQVYEGSPAEKAGIRAEDILYKVDGEEVTDRELNEVVTDIKGEKGTKVTLTLLRGEKREEIETVAVRETLEYRTVSSEMMDDGIGYIQITEFDGVTYDQYTEAYAELEDQGMQGLIVDLRGNPGGNLDTVCDILDTILPEGLIVYTEDKEGTRDEKVSDEEHQIDIPMAVLVNGYSASASEIFSGAVQDYGLGKIVGTQTYGKGVVQQIFDLKDGTSVKLTISEYFTPKGRSIDGEGITPDVEVEYEYDEENPDKDNQLEKALDVVREECGL